MWIHPCLFINVELAYFICSYATYIKTFISRLHDEFAIMDLGRLSYILGLEVTYTDSGLFPNQMKYAHNGPTRAKLLDDKPICTPLSTIEFFVSHGSIFTDHTQQLSVFYDVKGTIIYGLTFFHASTPSWFGYCDADWAHCMETRRSTYGHSIFLGGNLVSWSAKKQPTVSRSSCESEYRALANTAAEII
ncbi:uncharacterized mitochondrial protein AtMg00810-like [Rutidosis leptorrhynchoides]|uniref:uncharacterized mitochondrial protein AtMg00810-like n=1 Tax=Rutidosis leptorrhynchoides TaxID=125765 RepID=UPI003A98E150